MKNMFNVTTVLPHNLLQTNPCIRHNFSPQVFRERAAQLHYVGPELRYIFWPFLASFGGIRGTAVYFHAFLTSALTLSARYELGL